MRGSFKIARIAGIDISIHFTWILAFFLIAYFQVQSFSQFYTGWTTAQYWLAGFLCSIFLFIAVLLHELAHSLVAQARGLPVSSITLFIFGGVSNLTEEPENPGLEFWMALVGPLTSLVLGAVFWVVWYGMVGNLALPPFASQVPAAKQTVLTGIVGFLAYINVALAAFNLLPGFPLDGGRVFRSIIWKISGNLMRATNIATTVGRIFGWVLIAGGVFLFFSYGVAGLINGVWLAIIGIFLNSAAESSRQEVSVREHLAGVKVAQVMEANTETVNPRMSVNDLVREIFLIKRRRSIPVADGDQLVGMVSVSDVRHVPQHEWPTTFVERIMTRGPLHTVSPDDDLNAALKVISQYDLNQVPVMSQGRIVGILSRANVVNFLQLSAELGVKRTRKNPPTPQPPAQTRP